MSFWRQLTRGLRVLTSRAAADQELGDEVDHYLEESTASFRAAGLSPGAARREARLDLGNTTMVREEVRAHGWESALGPLVADMRYAARRLLRDRGFTAVSVITLALGIGATTAIFSAVNPILFEPLPYAQPDRITMISDAGPEGEPRDVTFGTYRELAQRSRAFEAIAPFKPWQPTMVGRGEPERLSGQRVGADFFRALGVSPFIGRDFQMDDDGPHGPNVAILSNGLWRR